MAIGKEGQNARLAAKLTGWKIDIKSETQALATGELEYADDTVESTPATSIAAANDSVLETPGNKGSDKG